MRDKKVKECYSYVRLSYAIYRGITTGLNDAFIIDNQTKEALVAQDPRSAEVIKRIVRGRDIRRYQIDWRGLWLIYSYTGIDINEFPAIRSHLLPHQTALGKRTGGARRDRNGNLFVPYEWYELQVDYYNSGAYKMFATEKLFWMDMSPEARFAYDDGQMFCNDKGFILIGESLKYLCAVLNSSLVTWIMKNTALTTGMGLIQWKKFAVERIPIPKLSAAEQHPFVELVDSVLTAKAGDRNLDTSEIETEIDEKVYQLYGLTPLEIAEVQQGI